jgi:predicted nucleic acid-binding protein
VTSKGPIHIYLDSNALIRFVEGTEVPLLALIQHARHARVQLFTSELTLAEVLVGPLKQEQNDLVSIYEQLLGDHAAMTMVPVGQAILRASATIRAKMGNKGPDAIHVATAQSCACSIFVSSDKRIKLPVGMRRIDSDAVGALAVEP